MFDITDIKIRLVNADSKLKAVASIVIDDTPICINIWIVVDIMRSFKFISGFDST